MNAIQLTKIDDKIIIVFTAHIHFVEECGNYRRVSVGADFFEVTNEMSNILKSIGFDIE